MIQEPDGVVLGILLKRDREAVRDVDPAFEALAEQNPDDALLGVVRDAMVVVNDREEDERMDDDLGRREDCIRVGGGGWSLLRSD